MNQLSLFSVPQIVPHNRTATSIQAARAIAGEVESIESKVLAFIERCYNHGATCDEVERCLALTHQTASARIRGLKLKGLIFESGRERKTRSGRNAAVLIAK